MKKMKKRVTLAEYGRLAGLSKSTLYRQRAEGKIIVGDDGLVTVSSADRDRAQNVSKRQKPKRPQSPEGGTKSAWELRLTRARALRVEQENRLRSGELVLASEVTAATESRFRADADALLSWPSRISAEMAGQLAVPERDLFRVLDGHVRAFMLERSKSPIPPDLRGGK